MKEFTLFKLFFNDGLHVGAGGFGEESIEEIIHSDTLFSAVCSAANILYGAEVVETYFVNGSVNISSTFPFYGDELFFPKPFSFSIPTIENYSDQKVFKKTKYVCKEYFEDILTGKLHEPTFSRADVLQSCWRKVNRKSNDILFSILELPRVTLDRVTNDSTIYHFSEIRFSKNAGLFFLADLQGEEKKYFAASLRFLGDEGIGADRTVGKGLFDVEESTITFDDVANPDSSLLLSLYSPFDDDLPLFQPEKSFYDITTRLGWVTARGGSTLRRQSLRMFTEGSVLSFDNGYLPKGSLVRVLKKKDHPSLMHDIFRNGKAFTLPIKIINEVV